MLKIYFYMVRDHAERQHLGNNGEELWQGSAGVELCHSSFKDVTRPYYHRFYSHLINPRSSRSSARTLHGQGSVNLHEP
jgi:hypothetical protein